MIAVRRINPADIDANAVRADANKYMRIRLILDEFRHQYRKRRITAPQYKTLRGQAIKGDVDGAIKGLCTILERSYR